MEPMTLKEFDSLGKRDYENGAVLNAIAAALKDREQMIATAQKSDESVVRQGTDGESGAVWRRIDTDKPPQGKDVLFVHDGEVMNGFLTWSDKYTIYGIPYDEVDEKNITYWMPLPQQPDA